MTIFRFSLLILLIVVFGLAGKISAETTQDQQESFSNCTDVANSTAIPKVECDALIALRDATSISTWGWATSNNPCEWFGVSCTDGQITALNFSLNGITGSLPSQLGNLDSLRILEIRRNSLTGSIPASLGNLNNLLILNLERNQLGGSIPASLGNLPNLAALQLNENRLTGTIPSQLGSISPLQFLYLYGNQLNGEIPSELGSLTDLTTLRLHDLNLEGSLPLELGNLVNLTFLQVSGNPNLEGAIPDEFSAMTAMTDFYLFNTNICVNSGSTAETWLETVQTVAPEDVTQCTTPLAVSMSDGSTSRNGEYFGILTLLTLLLTFPTVLILRYSDSGVFKYFR